MFGFNWVDAIIVIVLALVVIQGVRVGIVTQALTIAGFLGVMFLGGWIFPYLIPVDDITIKALINGALVLGLAGWAAVKGADYGSKVHWSFRLGKRTDRHTLKKAEAVLGTIPSLLAGLIFVWLIGVGIGRMPFAGLSNSVSDAKIVQGLTDTMPPVPAVFVLFNKQINPNTPPYVFAQPKPRADFDYSVSEVQQAEAKAAKSIVRLTGFGCGGLIGATGFVVDDQLVMTNAHVIAGVKRPIIKYDGRSYEAVPIYFDPTLDVAVLRVNNLSAPALLFTAAPVVLNTTAAILGYPGGNYQVVPSIIRDTRAVSARNIYDQDNAGRGLYELQARIEQGSSGSPVVLENGQVAGLVFGKSVDTPGYGFALTAPYLSKALVQAQGSQQRVSTRACSDE